MTSKIAIVGRSTRADADVDYLFAQAGVLDQVIDTSPNCGNMLAGVGPGSWSSLRPDEVELDHHALPKIVPLSSAPEFGVSARDPDPRGLPLFDAET